MKTLLGPNQIAFTVIAGVFLVAAACTRSDSGGSNTAGTATATATPGSGSGGSITPPPAAGLLVGADATAITPSEFEGYDDADGDGVFDASEGFFDTGVDRLFSYQEPGALGADGAPGHAGLDDDGDGSVDEDDEYLAAGSDDVRDPAADDYHPQANPGGTEGDGRFAGLPLAGFGGFITGLEYRYAVGILDDLWARTLAVEVNGTPFIWMSVDLVGLLHLDINPVKRRIERELGVPFANVVISSTHCHSGPDPVGIWAGGVDDAWLARLRDQMFQSARRAWLARRSARMWSASAEPPSGYDRSTLTIKHGAAAVHTADSLDEHLDPTRGFDHFLMQTDLRDPVVRNTTVASMRFEATDGSGTIASVVNWHDHPEVLGSKNLFISSDWPHYTRVAMEQRYGGVCLYVSGTVGGQIGALRGTPVPLRDQAGQPVFEPGVFDAAGNPFPRLVRAGNLDKIRSLGMIVAETAIASLDAAAPTPSPRLVVHTEDLLVDLENPPFQLLAFAQSRLNLRWTDPRDQPVRHPALVSSVGGIMTQISVVTLGDAQLVTAPGEIPPEYLTGRHESLVDYGSHGMSLFPAMPAIHSYMTGRDKFCAALANNYLGYLVPASDFLQLWQLNHPNFYEDMVSAGMNFGDNVGNKTLQMLGTPTRFSTYPTRP